LRFERPRDRKEMRKSPSFWWSVVDSVVVTLIITLIVGLPIGVIIGQNAGMIVGLAGGLSFALIFGSGGLIFAIRGSQRSPANDIQTVEALRWIWRKALKGGLIGGLVFLLLFWLLYLPDLFPGLNRLLNGPRIVLDMILYVSWSLIFIGQIFGPLGAVIGAILNGGLRREIRETKTIPNEGMRLSARNAILGGVIVGLVAALAFGWIPATLIQGPDTRRIELIITLGIGLLFALLGALWYGGLDVIQHYILRIILVIQGHIPINYAHFLDYAVDRIFLQKVGGGYRFIHRLLLEHFVEMSETTND
jgi:hypothetical protein